MVHWTHIATLPVLIFHSDFQLGEIGPGEHQEGQSLSPYNTGFRMHSPNTLRHVAECVVGFIWTPSRFWGEWISEPNSSKVVHTFCWEPESSLLKLSHFVLVRVNNRLPFCFHITDSFWNVLTYVLPVFDGRLGSEKCCILLYRYFFIQHLIYPTSFEGTDDVRWIRARCVQIECYQTLLSTKLGLYWDKFSTNLGLYVRQSVEDCFFDRVLIQHHHCAG